MPTIARYRPIWSAGGRRIFGPDEDAFTAAATALEGAFPIRARERPTGELRLAGPLPPVAQWGLPALLDGSARVARFASIRDALPDPAELGSRPDLVIVAFDPGPDRAGPVAVAIRGGAESSYGAIRSDMEGELAASDPGGPTIEIDPARRERVEAMRLDVVSEGAYIPRARYLESLPSRWRLGAQECSACGATTFPIRSVCRACGRSEGLTPTALAPDGGEIVAITEIGGGGQPTEFDGFVEAAGPYRVGLVEWEPGVRATLMVSDDPEGTVRIGSRVRTVLRRLYPMEGEWRYGRKIVPARP